MAPDEPRAKKFNWKVGFAVAATVVIVAGIGVALRPPPTEMEVAIGLVKSNRHAAALPVLEQIEHKQPDNEEVNAWLAQCYLRTDRIAEGRTALDTAIRYKLPSTLLVPVVQSYADFYESKDDFAEAEKLYASAQNVCSEKDLAAGLATLYMRWSDYEAQKSDTEAALKHLQQAYQLMPATDPVKETVPHKINEYYRELAAVAEMQKNDDSKAIQLLEASLKWSDEPATRMALGSIYLRQNKTDKAIENYKSVTQHDENNLEARHRLVDLYMQKQDLEGAQAALTELTEKERSVENFETLASLSLKIGNYAAAVRAMEDAITLKPKDIPLLTALHNALLQWSSTLQGESKAEQASSVKGHADRVADLIKELKKDDSKIPEQVKIEQQTFAPGSIPVSLVSSRIWLARGSLTPEGEIRLKNVSGGAVTDLALNMVINDITTHKRAGAVTVTAASDTHPMEADSAQVVYFSSPTTVKTDHKLAVVIYWKGRLIKELPVVKER